MTADRTRPRPFSTLRRSIFRGVLVLALAAGAGLWYLARQGAPRWMLRLVRDRVQLGEYVFETGALRLDPARGIVLEDVRSFRQHVLGPAVLEAEEVVLPVNILAAFKRSSRIPEVIIRNAVVRPALALLDAQGPAGGAAPDRAEAGAPLHIGLRIEDSLVEGHGGELLVIERLTTELHHADGKTTCHDLDARVRHPVNNMAGTIRGRLVYEAEADKLSGALALRVDPHALVPVLRELEWKHLVYHIGFFDFGATPPDIELEFENIFGVPTGFELSGTIRFRECEYKGVELLRGDADITVRSLDFVDVAVTFDPLLLVRPEGIAQVSLTVNSSEETVAFRGRTTIDPKAALGMIGVLTNEEFQSVFTFHEKVTVEAEGTAWYAYPGDADFTARIRGRQVQIWRMMLDEVAMEMIMQGGTNRLNNVVGTAYGGNLVGWAEFIVPFTDDTNTAYTICCELVEADFARVVKALGGEQGGDYRGWFAANIAIGGVMGAANVETIRGRGEIVVDSGRIFTLPIFGGLSTTMTKIIPGLDFVLRQGAASAEFVVEEGKIHADKVLIEGDVLSLLGRGDYYLDDNLDFDIQLTLMKEGHLLQRLIRVLTYPISKLFEFRLQGTLAAPEWKPVHFSSILLEKLGLKKENGREETEDRGPESGGGMRDEHAAPASEF